MAREPVSGRKDFREHHVRPRPGRTLIVGSKVFPGRENTRFRFEDAIGIDMQDGDGVDLVHDMEAPLPEGLGMFDHVECTSVLEHTQRPWKVAENIEACMVQGATIYLTVPVVWRFHGYPHDYWRFLRGAIEVIFPTIEWIVSVYRDRDGKMSEDYRLPVLDGGNYSRIELYAFGVRK